MHFSTLFLYFFSLNLKLYKLHPQGPPPTDSGTYSQYTYYYDVYINESTKYLLDLDPKVDQIQALYMEGNIVISERELQKFFLNINHIAYGIRINNTNLKNLSFLKLYWVDSLDDTKTSIVISNNQNLTKIGIDFNYCTYCYNSIAILNNPQLDLRDECDGIVARYTTNREITGNLVDCGCTIKGSFNKYIATLPSNCFWLVGNVTIDQNSNYTLLQKKFENITRISGGLSVSRTNFTDLSFLKPLQLIEVDARKADALPSLTITLNPNLTSLGMNPVRDGIYLMIRENPNLCVLIQELEKLFAGFSMSADIDTNICFDKNTPENVCKTPVSGKLKDYPDGCTSLVGNLVLDAEYDYMNGYKLYDIAVIYGSLTINSSELRTTNMLFNLKNIRSVHDSVPPFTVFNNSKLTDLVIPDGIDSGTGVRIEKNPNLRVFAMDCGMMRTSVSPIVRDNLSNCNSTDLLPQYDKTPTNEDSFVGLLTYPSVVDSSNPDGGTQNQPGNETDYEEEDEEEPPVTDKFSTMISLFVTLFLILVFVE